MQSDSPLHIALIPDGNRRWAKARMLHPWKGHEKAIENFRALTEWCRKHPRISTLTVWCFSTENWKRSEEEVLMLMRILEEYLQRERSGFLEQKTRFVHSGRRDRIPSSLAALLSDVERETADLQEFTLHLAVDYGGRDEVIRAMEKLGTARPTEDALRQCLDHPELPDLDLIVRTSGEQRTSNFFLWQSTYAEWIFFDKLFPDLSVEDLDTAVAAYDSRKRRFGG